MHFQKWKIKSTKVENLMSNNFLDWFDCNSLNKSKNNAWHENKDELWNVGKADNPNGNELVPEFIVKSCWIFQPKNEQVPSNDYPIQEKHQLSHNWILKHQFNETNCRRKWTKHVPENKQFILFALNFISVIKTFNNMASLFEGSLK